MLLAPFCALVRVKLMCECCLASFSCPRLICYLNSNSATGVMMPFLFCVDKHRWSLKKVFVMVTLHYLCVKRIDHCTEPIK